MEATDAIRELVEACDRRTFVTIAARELVTPRYGSPYYREMHRWDVGDLERVAQMHVDLGGTFEIEAHAHSEHVHDVLEYADALEIESFVCSYGSGVGWVRATVTEDTPIEAIRELSEYAVAWEMYPSVPGDLVHEHTDRARDEEWDDVSDAMASDIAYALPISGLRDPLRGALRAAGYNYGAIFAAPADAWQFEEPGREAPYLRGVTWDDLAPELRADVVLAWCEGAERYEDVAEWAGAGLVTEREAAEMLALARAYHDSARPDARDVTRREAVAHLLATRACA